MDEDSPGDARAAFRGKAGPPPLTQAQIERARLKKGEGFFDPTMLRTSKYSTLSGQKTSEKFSFGSATRFPSASSKISTQLQRSKSSPAWSAMASTAASDADGLAQEASLDFTSAEPSRVLTTEPSVEERGRGSLSSPTFMDEEDDWGEGPGTPSIRYPPPPATDRLSAPRLEGSLLRLGEPQQRSALPRAHSYDPVQTLGPGSSSTFNMSPNWSFGGGPSRTYEKKEHLAHILCNTSSAKKGKVSRLAVTLMDLKDATRSTQKPQAPLSRGFGSQVRLALKGGPMELPISPGPGAYELMRTGDNEPVWMHSNGKNAIWHKRTSGRADLRNKGGTAPNLAPGDSIQDQSFKASGPTPILGHPAHDIARQEFPGLDPSRYNLASSLCKDRSPIHTVGTGKRPNFAATNASPGPAQYSPRDDVCHPYGPALSFGKSTRMHECDLVDPDEPPGPGAHTVRRDPKVTDKPSTGLPRDTKRGFGASSFIGPAPCDCFRELPSSLAKRGRSIGVLLPRPREESPGPHDTGGPDPYTNDSLCHDAGPSWGSLVNRSSVRKPPWRQISQPPVFQLKSGEKLIMTNVPIQFKPTGPKWSMMPRREEHRWNLPCQADSEAMIMASSIG